MTVSGAAVAITAVGGVMLYSAAKNAPISKTVQSFLAGKPIPGTGVHGSDSGSGYSAGYTDTSTLQGIAQASIEHKGLADDALQYQGAGYIFGGAPGKGRGNWDCSSFVNWVVGHDLGMAIPRYRPGQYDGSSHGPVVAEWVAWTGCTTVKGPPSTGDLCLWPGVGAFAHMGIAISNTHMISALDSKDGTVVTPIKGYGPGPVIIYRRLKANG